MTLSTNIPGLAIVAAASGLALGLGFSAACGPQSGSPIPDDRDGGESHETLNETDAGCPLKSDGPRSGSVGTSVPRSGTGEIAWASPENARNVDGQFARTTLDLGRTSEHLRITAFGFTIPASAKIKGVEAEFKRRAGDTGIVDGTITLWLDGVASSRPKYISTTWPRTIVGTHTYGQAVDTWGDDLTPALAGRPGFGVQIYAVRQEDGGSPIEATVESIRLTIYYCE